jgi:Lar family restriction alleviation protein
MKNMNIRPCPFCGGNQFKVDTMGADKHDRNFWVVCLNPTCETWGPYGKAKSNAIVKWNKRSRMTWVTK